MESNWRANGVAPDQHMTYPPVTSLALWVWWRAASVVFLNRRMGQRHLGGGLEEHVLDRFCPVSFF